MFEKKFGGETVKKFIIDMFLVVLFSLAFIMIANTVAYFISGDRTETLGYMLLGIIVGNELRTLRKEE
jgi:hypothetical protein